MLVWRKGNIEEKKLSVLTVFCTIIMVHKDMSSCYRLVDYWALILLGLALSSERFCVFGLRGAI